MKGPSAAALYGTAAANGVIIITTKRGRVGRPEWNFYTEQGIVDEITTFPNNFRGLDTLLVIDCRLSDVAAGRCTQNVLQMANPLESKTTSPIGQGRRQQYGLNVTGGTEDIQYYISGEWEVEDGVMELPRRTKDSIAALGVELPKHVKHPNRVERASMRANIQARLGEKTDLRLRFAMVSAGSGHTCGATMSGTAYCWGDLGNGRVDNDFTTGSTVPEEVGGGLTFASVEVGGDHRCGTTEPGVAFCWGAGSNGRLGDGSLTDQTEPTEVYGGLGFTWVGVGGSHTCGVVTDGAVYCWGLNGSGQVGDRTTVDRNIPVPVAGGLTFTSVSAGNDHACGLEVSGAVYCWGLNLFGQLGDGTNTDRTEPAPVAGGLEFAAVSAGRLHTCGVIHRRHAVL